MKFKRLISLFITVVMLAGSMAAVSAASFPDIESRHSWAEDAIDSMVSRGILKGYTDGTFKPDRPVTHLETLIIASRIMGVDEDTNAEYKEAALEEYLSILASYEIDYKAEVAYLLYTGVLKADELPNYISNTAKDKALKRYEAAVLLTKLIGGEKEALSESIIVLDFEDQATIPSSAKAYVKYVADAGLMNGVEGNEFSPNGELTRAMIATIMYRGEQYMNVSTVEGVVEEKSESTIIASVKGVSKAIDVPEDAFIKIDGKTVEMEDLSVGQYIRAHYQGEALRYIDAVTSNLYQTVTGTITSIADISGSRKITLKTTTGSQTYTISPDYCKYIVDNTISTFTDIKKNMYATLNIQGGYITEISVETGSKKVQGTLTEVVIGGDYVALMVETTDGEIEYVLSDSVKITRNGSNSDTRSLAVGDTVKLVLANGLVSTVDASSSVKSESGTITKIVIASNSEITIKTGKTEKAYGVTSNTKFTVDGKEDCTIYDLRLGAAAEVRLDSANILSIKTQSAVATPTLTGVITYVHPTGYVMGIKVLDHTTGEYNEVQTVVSAKVTVTDSTSSRITEFKKLEEGMSVVVVGSSNYGVYEVSQIIVTAVAE